MAPKKPVKIGLKKKNNTEVEQVEVQDVDTTIPPLSASCMESLEEIVGENEEVILYDDIVDVVPPDSLDLFEDEMERDQDPDWVDPKPVTKSILKINHNQAHLRLSQNLLVLLLHFEYLNQQKPDQRI